jgi:hypothetical protein
VITTRLLHCVVHCLLAKREMHRGRRILPAHRGPVNVAAVLFVDEPAGPCRHALRVVGVLESRLDGFRKFGIAMTTEVSKSLIFKDNLVGPEGFEPSTNGLRVRCSTN